jgi:hypothetical protein
VKEVVPSLEESSDTEKAATPVLLVIADNPFVTDGNLLEKLIPVGITAATILKSLSTVANNMLNEEVP